MVFQGMIRLFVSISTTYRDQAIFLFKGNIVVAVCCQHC